MCGIAGIVTKNKNDLIGQYIDGMLDTIKHRGPDGCSKRVFDGRIALGHRRLSIIDLSEDGLQPMQYASRYWITYNGEIYNYIELKDELLAYGYSFNTETDTEVILAAYIQWGDKCVNHFNGMWAFAIYDSKRDIIFCSRDRFGVKPFYIYSDERNIAFASEIKELLALPFVSSVANKERLVAFLASGITETGDTTMFRGVVKLLPGYNMMIDGKTLSITKESYYVISKKRINNDNLYADFYKKFSDAIKYRLRADVPVGSCLSGGLDSSAIVCEAYKQLAERRIFRQFAVSSCFENKIYDEQEYIDEVINKTGVTSYKVFPDMNKVFEELDDIIWHMDEPFDGTSIYAQWCVFREAKNNGLTVMLDGQGADEQLAGYTPFYKVLFIDCLKKVKLVKLYKEMKAYRKLRADAEVMSYRSMIVSTFTAWLLPNRVRYWLNKIYVRRTGGMPYPNIYYDNEYTKKLFFEYDKKSVDRYISASVYEGLQSLLHYEDRNSMAHSIEARVPFLDYKLVEFIYSIPITEKIVNGKTKNVLREALRNVLPDKIYKRYTKLGFVTPEDQWLKNNEVFFYNELDKACGILGSLVDKERVLNWYKSHVRQTQMGDSTCFRIICAAHWVQVFGVSLE